MNLQLWDYAVSEKEFPRFHRETKAQFQFEEKFSHFYFDVQKTRKGANGANFETDTSTFQYSEAIISGFSK